MYNYFVFTEQMTKQMAMNYKHLHYFWTVAKTGSILNASEALHITPQTISGQISLLEDTIGEKLFRRQGRRNVLTSKGKVVFKYADQIFNLGEELGEFLKGSDIGEQGEFKVGIMDGVPKTIAYKILSPVIDDKSLSIICNEGSFSQLIGKLAIRELDMVISDMPVSSAYSIKAYNHKLGESPMTCFALKSEAKQYRKNFPKSLDHTDMLLPTDNSTVRPAIDQWMMSENISPNIVGEFDDSALLKAFGQAGAGLFFMPSIIEAEVCSHYDVEPVGTTDKIREQFYAISLERQLSRGLPILSEIYNSAKSTVF